MRHRSRSDDGAGTVLVLTATAVVALVGVVVLALVAGVVDRQRAQAAADLAAMSAARQGLLDSTVACAVARRVAEAHDARIEACVVESVDVVSVVTVIERHGLLRPDVRGVARAGRADQSADTG